MTDARTFDYIIVGSGSAGSTLAARLSEDGRHSVLMIEAGPSDRSIYIQMPAALGYPLLSERFNWNYYSEPEPHLENRRICEARGRVLGGSSSINGMNWVRGNPWDYDNWVSMGLKGWSYADCLPYFKRAETFDGGANLYRGGTGPMKIQTCAAENQLFRAFLEAGVQAGYGRVEDHNAFRQEGMHVTQRNVHKGIRWSTSQAYIHQSPPHPNLKIITGTRVTRIEFSNRRAVRVHCLSRDAAVAFEVGREVVLSGGAINTPQLMLLSGIGDADDLKKLSIPVVAHLAGVGRGLRDHLAAPVQYVAKGNVSIGAKLNLVGRAKLAAQWLLFKNGLGATNFFETGAFIRTDDSIKVPNIQFEFIPILGDFHQGGLTVGNGLQYFFALTRPKSTGRVWIDSADPTASPKFVFNYFAEEEDRLEAIAAVKAVRRIVAQSGWSKYRGKEVTPGADAKTDDEILAFLRRHAGTQYHPCRTCRMGHDDSSVVDEAGRVHETDNLRIVDASIMPEIITGNLNAPVIMMAEKLADSLLGRAPLPSEPAAYYQA